MVSFSGAVKDELEQQYSKGRHCQMAEIAGIISQLGRVKNDENSPEIIQVSSENIAIIRKLFTLLKKAFKMKVVQEVRANLNGGKGRLYTIKIPFSQSFYRMCMNPDLSHSCCKRAYIRGVFLCSGSVADPHKSYHLEIVCSEIERARKIEDTINRFEMDAKIIDRKNHYVVYLKEGSQIADLLNVMEAHNALMEFENVRILKEVRNSVNRKVNCETANINKTVSAAVKQIEDIRYLSNVVGLENLPPSLEEMARVRLEYPDAALKELGDLLTPPVGKSGVNHRLRKLGILANEYRG